MTIFIFYKYAFCVIVTIPRIKCLTRLSSGVKIWATVPFVHKYHLSALELTTSDLGNISPGLAVVPLTNSTQIFLSYLLLPSFFYSSYFYFWQEANVNLG